MWANRASGTSDGIAYPAGRSRLEPVAVVTCAMLMAMAALQVIREASTELIDAYRSGEIVLLKLGVLDIAMMVGTIVLKLFLWLWCKRIAERTNNVTVDAVAQDNFNDILSNAGAVLAAGFPQLGIGFAGVALAAMLVLGWPAYLLVDLGGPSKHGKRGGSRDHFLPSSALFRENDGWARLSVAVGTVAASKTAAVAAPVPLGAATLPRLQSRPRSPPSSRCGRRFNFLAAGAATDDVGAIDSAVPNRSVRANDDGRAVWQAAVRGEQ
jgi:hypothetical protein